MKQGQGHQTWYDLVDPKEGYNNANFEKPRLNGVHEKVNNKDFVKSENISFLPINMFESQK